MTPITLHLNETASDSWKLTPFEFNFNAFVTNSVLNTRSFTSWRGNTGGAVNWAGILQKEYVKRRTAGVNYTSPRLRMLDVSFTRNGSRVTGYIDYTYTYDVLMPQTLAITIYNGGSITGDSQYSFMLTYDSSGNPSGFNNSIVVCITYLENFANILDSYTICVVPMGGYGTYPSFYGGGFIYKDFDSSQPWDPSQITYELLNITTTDLTSKGVVSPNLWSGYNQKWNEFNHGSFIEVVNAVSVPAPVINDDIFDPTPSDENSTTPSKDNPNVRDVSEEVPDDGIPNNSSVDSGFIKVWQMSGASLKDLADFMLTDNFLNNVKKLVLQPLDYIVGLHMIPVAPDVGAPSPIIIGGISTGVNGNPVTNSYKEIDFGSVDVKEMYSSFLDFDPVTQISIYLPFIGFQTIRTTDCMDGKIHLKYKINVVTGDCMAVLTIENTHQLNGVMYCFNGSMIENIPITNVDKSQRMAGFLGAVTQAGIASSLGSAPMALGALSGAISSSMIKPQVNRSGSLSGSAGIMGVYTPFIIKIRPVKSIASNFKELHGYQSHIGGKVKDFRGYNEFGDINLTGISCTENERNEIDRIMKGGVFV